MTKIWNTLKKAKASAFTLLEMLVVLIIISVLMLLFVPNLAKQKEAVAKTGNAAVVKVVESQAELYKLTNKGEPTLALLKDGDYITDEHVKAYNEYYASNTEPPRAVN